MTSRFRRPESVLIVVHTADLECLLLERVAPAGFWQSVTGTLHWGESPREAALRELREETGIRVDADSTLRSIALRDAGVTRRFPILPEWRSRYAPGVEENEEHLWYLALPKRVAVTVDPAEHLNFDWLRLEAAIEKVTSWTNREALERLAARA